MVDSTAATKAATPGAVITKEMADAMQDDGQALAMEFRREDVAQSFLKIAQALSPEVDESESQHIKGLKPGFLFNSGTSSFSDGKVGLLVAPVHYQRGFTEWAPRSSSKSLVNDFGPDMPAIIKSVDPVKGSWPLENGNTIIESAVYVLLIIDPKTGEFEQAVLNLSGTQHKKSRRWNRALQNARAKHPVSGQVFQPAPFYYTYRLTTVKEENDEGKWFGIVITPDSPLLDLPNGAELYQLCRGERQVLMSGAKKVRTVAENTVEREPGDFEEFPNALKAEDDDLPF